MGYQKKFTAKQGEKQKCSQTSGQLPKYCNHTIASKSLDSPGRSENSQVMMRQAQLISCMLWKSCKPVGRAQGRMHEKEEDCIVKETAEDVGGTARVCEASIERGTQCFAFGRDKLCLISYARTSKSVQEL